MYTSMGTGLFSFQDKCCDLRGAGVGVFVVVTFTASVDVFAVVTAGRMGPLEGRSVGVGAGIVGCCCGVGGGGGGGSFGAGCCASSSSSSSSSGFVVFVLVAGCLSHSGLRYWHFVK